MFATFLRRLHARTRPITFTTFFFCVAAGELAHVSLIALFRLEMERDGVNGFGLAYCWTLLRNAQNSFGSFYFIIIQSLWVCVGWAGFLVFTGYYIIVWKTSPIDAYLGDNIQGVPKISPRRKLRWCIVINEYPKRSSICYRRKVKWFFN